MKLAPIPENEKERLASLHNLGLLDSKPEERFDRITRAAIHIFHVPISTLTLVDAKREWFKSCQGLPSHEGDRAVSFCGHALVSPEIMVVKDTLKDDRFADNPMVTGEPYIRFYAGVPILSTEGQKVGVFCIKDTKPRELSLREREILKGLTSWAEVEINSRNLSLALSEGWKIQALLKNKTDELEKLHKSEEKINKAMLNVMEDLEGMKAQTEIEKAKDEAMLSSIGEGLIAVDTEGKVIMMNEIASDMLDLKLKNTAGTVITNLRLEDEEGKLIPFKKRPTTIALSTGKLTKVTFFYVKKKGIRIPLAITAAPIKLAGKTIGLIEIVRDITREQETDKAKSEFISLASHQLRTPLGLTKWYLEVLKSKDYISKAPDEIKEYFDEIYKSNERVLSLARNLLSVSRIEQGRIKNTPSSVDLVKEIREMVDQMRIIAKNKGITLNLIVRDLQIPTVYIDVLRFHEVTQNLIENAIKYSNPGGTVQVVINKISNLLLINVIDTGIGISKTDQGRLFSKFSRSDDAVKHNPEGSGLGLYIVKSYVEGWGGKVFVESVKSKGSTFAFSLPISQKEKT